MRFLALIIKAEMKSAINMGKLMPEAAKMPLCGKHCGRHDRCPQQND